MNDMVPILTGFLAGHVISTGTGLMKIADVTIDPPDAFRVYFASGLVLRVKVDQATDPTDV